MAVGRLWRRSAHSGGCSEVPRVGREATACSSMLDLATGAHEVPGPIFAVEYRRFFSRGASRLTRPVSEMAVSSWAESTSSRLATRLSSKCTFHPDAAAPAASGARVAVSLAALLGGRRCRRPANFWCSVARNERRSAESEPAASSSGENCDGSDDAAIWLRWQARSPGSPCPVLSAFPAKVWIFLGCVARVLRITQTGLRRGAAIWSTAVGRALRSIIRRRTRRLRRSTRRLPPATAIRQTSVRVDQDGTDSREYSRGIDRTDNHLP